MSKTITIESTTDIDAGLAALRNLDPRLGPLIDCAGEIPLRRSPPGFEGLARIIIAQQVSKASADAIIARTQQVLIPFSASAFLACDDETRKQMGLSRPKQRTFQAVAEAIENGDIDLHAIANHPPASAITQMTAIKGIGPWTAEVYLLFCAGHCDIFPAGDLALQIAAHESLGLRERPTDKQMRKIAESWAPWRSVAARLLWAWYGTARNRAIMP